MCKAQSGKRKAEMKASRMQRSAQADSGGEEFVTKRELARKLKVSVRTIEQWQHDGHLPYLRIDGVVLFHLPTVVKTLTEKFTVRRGILGDHGTTDRGRMTNDE